MIRLSDKLNHKKFEPFKVLRDIKEITYELKLLIIMRIHLIFHISLLKLASLEIPEDLTPILKKGMSKEEYKVKRIINVMKRRNRLL
jgi:hypothetical protein